MADVDLEHALAQFILTFRSTVLGDPKLIMLGQTARDESIGEQNEGQRRNDSSDENDEIVN